MVRIDEEEHAVKFVLMMPPAARAPIDAALAERGRSDLHRRDSRRAGHRANDRARVMRVVAAGLTDEDVKAVAEYIATLAGGE